MILTGAAIAEAAAAGEIVIDPFDPARLSSNAYDWRLGDTLWICSGDLDAATPTDVSQKITVPADGYLLEPGVLYLGHTLEKTSSEHYAQLINGDRTIGALGIWVHVSAPLGHVGHGIQWTLEIRVAKRVRVYAGMTFGKLVFLRAFGPAASYQRHGLKYAATSGIDISRLYEEIGSSQ
ncbi:dCTP deaminase domain-containing protein [Kribbella sp. NPDC051587]|uniref:dCTP deaminase n=1 Tax=Kribbella sp. NPDC051587 TaxID=3364119 RepID=UPI00379075CE